jgi:tetratricopeptide (TPR) repeat protein
MPTVTRRAVSTNAPKVVETTRGDRFSTWMKIGIAAGVVLTLTVLIFGLLADIINPAAPRTATEFALKRYETQLKADPKNGETWGAYIKVLYGIGKKREAYNAVADARKVVKDAGLVYVNNAELDIMINDGRNAEASKLADKYIGFDNDMRAAIEKKNAAGGITVPIEKMQLQNQTSIELAIYKAKAAGNLKQWGQAIDILGFALKADPTAADVMTLRGWAYLNRNQKDDLAQAKRHFTAAIQFLPDYASALEGLQKVESLEASKTKTPAKK